MTPARLSAIGRALYGDRWQSALAAALGVADRTVRRWAAGTSPVPDGAARDMTALLNERAGMLRDLIGARDLA